MRSLSKVIKSSRVLYDKEPRVLKLEDTSGEVISDETGNVEEILAKNARESAELSLKAALSKAIQISERASIESNLAFNEALRAGSEKGFEEGLKKGREDGEKKSVEMVFGTAQDFITKLTALDMKFYKQLSEERSDCVDFAFQLAENILNITIDREAPEYKELLSEFMKPEPQSMILKADGRNFPFNTLLAQDLANHIDNLNYISFEKIESRAEQETEQQVNETSTENAPLNQKEEELTTGTEQTDDEIIAETNEFVGEYSDDDISGENEAMPEDKPESLNIESTQPEQVESEPEASEETDYEKIEEESESPESELQNEKFVFVRPAVKNVALPRRNLEEGNFTFQFEDIQFLKPDVIKAIARKADIRDLAVALNGADESFVNSVTDALTMRLKEKVLDVKQYLGPIPQQELEEARLRLTKLAQEITRERS
ncbi:MAG TPA: FliG C-terminal domain-containing protein [Ruminiclostridium sp.]|nr:FliG C-terminal domain-containing protein [Ruminiclostridium sp.]